MANFIEIKENNGNKCLVDTELIYSAYWNEGKFYVEFNTIGHSHENGYDLTKRRAYKIMKKIKNMHIKTYVFNSSVGLSS